MKVSKSNKMRMVTWIIMLAGGAALSFWMDRVFFRSWMFDLYEHFFSLAAGIVLSRFVIIVSRNTGRALARLGREGDDVPKMETNRLANKGVYGCMRHPMHFGLLFFPWAVALLFGSPSFILIIAPAEMIFMLIMIELVEEPEAIRKFGDAYRAYQRQVPMFNLRPSCLRRLLNEDLAAGRR